MQKCYSGLSGKFRLTPGCKINLGLRVGKLRSDGYHDLQTLFYPLPYPADEIILEPGGAPGITLRGSAASTDDLVLKAYHVFTEAVDWHPAISANLVKRIPQGSGLGGGSADAAAMLLFLNNAGPQLGQPELMRLAALIGADAAFFLLNTPALGLGKGEIIKPVPIQAAGYWLALICPAIHSSTREVFASLDRIRCMAGENPLTVDKKGYTKFCFQDFPHEVSALDLHNDLEAPVFTAHPALATIKTALLAGGATQAAMSGSGSSIYGIFEDMRIAAGICADFRKKGVKAYLLPMQNFGM